MGGLRKLRLTSQCSMARQCIELVRQDFVRNAFFNLQHNYCADFLHQRFTRHRDAKCFVCFVAQPHEGLEFTLFVVVNKQLFRQCRLVIQHVDQKTQRAEIVAKLIESTCRPGTLFIDFGDQHLLYTVTHAQHSLRRLFQPQNRQHTAHLRKLAGYIAKH